MLFGLRLILLLSFRFTIILLDLLDKKCFRNFRLEESTAAEVVAEDMHDEEE